MIYAKFEPKITIRISPYEDPALTPELRCRYEKLVWAGIYSKSIKFATFQPKHKLP